MKEKEHEGSDDCRYGIHEPVWINTLGYLTHEKLNKVVLEKHYEATSNIINKNNKPDNVNHPNHYGGMDNPFEAIKIIEHYDLNFNLGNAVKYVLRAGKKDDFKQDLEKAVWYLQREINKK